MTTTLRVAVVHDYLTQRGGAERVALALLRAFPGARLVTSVYRPDSTYQEFRQHEVETLWTDRLPWVSDDPRRLLPLLPRAFSGHQLTDIDVAVCSSSGFAHGIGTDAPRIVYCHNPARWLYQPDDYFAAAGGAVLRRTAGLLGAPLRVWDQRQARSAEVYLANSTAVAERIRRTYGREPRVLHPPVGIDPAGPREAVPGLEPGFLLTVGRSRGYKNTSALCEAVQGMPGERLVVVGGLPQPWEESASGRLVGVSGVPDAQLRWLYANCAMLLAVSHEDFGLTPIEANAFGKPVLALRAGGYLDSVVEGVTGLFVDDVTAPSIQAGVRALRRLGHDPREIQAHAESFSPAAFAASIREEVNGLLARR